VNMVMNLRVNLGNFMTNCKSSTRSLRQSVSQSVSNSVRTVLCPKNNDADYISEVLVLGTDIDSKAVSVRDVKALDGGEWPASGPGRFTPFEISLDTHSIAGLLVPTASLGTLGERKIP